MSQLTDWSDSTKTPTTWTSDTAEPATSWANGDVKIPTAFVSVSDNQTGWFLPGIVPTPYLYDDPTLAYDSSMRAYNSLTFLPANQLNTSTPTSWSED
jgi:hypothetical protein